MSVITTTPMAPLQTVQGGGATPGGHVRAWRACKSFDRNSTFALVLEGTTNPWRPSAPAHSMYEILRATKPADIATIGAVLDFVKAHPRLGYSPATTMAHLRWLYTWGGGHMLVNGVGYSSSAPAAPSVVPQAPAKDSKAESKAPAAKGRARAKASA